MNVTKRKKTLRSYLRMIRWKYHIKNCMTMITKSQLTTNLGRTKHMTSTTTSGKSSKRTNADGILYIITLYRRIIRKQILNDTFIEGGAIQRRYDELMSKY